MFELRSDVIPSADQVPGVNCQLIVRSELLELPQLELIARLREEAEENPALEVEYEPPHDEIPTTPVRYEGAPSRPGGEAREWSDPTARAPDRHDLRAELHRRLGALAQEPELELDLSGTQANERGRRRQLPSWSQPEQVREIAGYLIENIDERGYLSTTVLDAAFELDVDPERVERALRAVQQIAPPGVGARDLRECLTLQLETIDDVPAHVRAVVEHCEEVMGGAGCDGLRRALGLSRAELTEALNFIRERLAPYPGEQFRPRWQHLLEDNPHAKRPDVILRRAGDEIEVELVSSRRLRVRVATAYRRLDERMRRNNRRAEDDATARARAQVRSARQILWSLQQRERSLYMICRAIVDHQRDFIREGPLAHRPLTHKRIAEATGLHESTVSRATMGKLVMMPSGESVPFTVFFDDALPAKTVLRSVVAGESVKSPLTDEQIQERLADEGFDLARRTVNKYRRALGIPSSGQRRRMYQAAA